MEEEWDLLKFSDIWDNQGWAKSIEYKNSFVPTCLYKYVPLFDDNQTENDIRLKSLQEKTLWVSNYKYLNDPFEFKALFLDRERIKKYGWNIGDIEKCLELAKGSTQIGCFSNYGASHMPLWAHYSNNHKGYCVKYKVTEKIAIYPVMYIEKREATATIPTKICSELFKGFEKGKEPGLEFEKYLIYLYISFTAKFKHWKYEDEFRFFNIEHIESDKKGVSIPLTQANMNTEQIYVGLSCKHKDKLKEIGKEIGCEVYEIVFDEYSEKFELRAERVA
jgi:hypothetical protein